MNEVQEQFLKTLESLKASAKAKKNTLEYDEILNAFNGIELTEDKMDMILEYLEKNHIDILQGKSPEDVPDDDLLLESEEDILLSDNEEIGLISDVDILEGVSIEDPVRMYLKEIGKVPLLSPDEETELAQKMSDGAMAKEQLESMEGQDIPEGDLAQLKSLIREGDKAKQKLAEANLRLVVSLSLIHI